MLPYVRVPLLYGVVSVIWIYCSDSAVRMMFDSPDAMTTVSMWKGWIFVVVTTGMLYALIRRDCVIHAEREKDKREFLEENIRAMNHITRNFLQKMTIFREYAERTEGFDKEVLQLYDTIIDDASVEIQRVSDIKKYDSTSIRHAIEPRPHS